MKQFDIVEVHTDASNRMVGPLLKVAMNKWVFENKEGEIIDYQVSADNPAGGPGNAVVVIYFDGPAPKEPKPTPKPAPAPKEKKKKG